MSDKSNKDKQKFQYDAFAQKVAKFGDDVEMSPNMAYVNAVRGGKKFAIVQPTW